MKFKDIINHVEWKEIQNELVNEYPETIKFIPQFESIYKRLEELPPKNNSTQIVIKKQKEADTDDEYIKVSGIQMLHDEENLYNISQANLDEWLGMEITEDTVNNYNGSEIAAHCLFEITFCNNNNK